MPVGGKSNSTEQLNDHPTEHNHSAEAISDIVDRFADLRLYVPAANSCGVDGALIVGGRLEVPNAAIRGYDGNETWPAFTFQSDTNTGIYRVAADTLGITAGGQKVATWDTTGHGGRFFGPGHTTGSAIIGERYGDGTNAYPTYRFYGDEKTGFYRAGASSIEFVGNGKRLLQIGIGNEAGVLAGAWMPTISTRTVTAPGNVYIDTNVAQEGALYRSTASRAVMQEIEAVNLDATNSVYDLAPIWFRSKCEGDNLEHSHYGLAAEDCAAVDPRLAIMATDENGTETADNVNTNAVIALLVSAVQEQRATISDLTARVEALENA
jgi:hypothetical protein